MAVASAATSHTMKLMKLTLSIFRPRFSSSKCKTAAKMAVARIKLLRNKREVVVRQMRRDIALLLQSGQDATARIRVEHVIREQNILAANEFIEVFCELIVTRLPIIARQRECPADLKESIASLIFASPRCSEIPELVDIRKIIEKKYGRDFVSAATDLRPNCGVNRMLIDKLSVRTPTGDLKLKVMKDIAKEHQIEWDTTESEKELLKAPEQLTDGPHTFVSASSLPVKPATFKSVEPNKLTTSMHFEDPALAAEAAAESAKQAIAAAQAAAYIANKNQASQLSSFDHNLNSSSINSGFGMDSQISTPSDPWINHQIPDHHFKAPGRIYDSHSFDRSHYSSNGETIPTQVGSEQVNRRHSYNNSRPIRMGSDHANRRHSYNETRPIQQSEHVSRRQNNSAFSPHSDIKFDESDCDEDIEIEEPPAGVYPPPQRSPPPVPSSHVKQDPVHQVHHKLPDYDALTARFEALKYRKSQT